MPRNLSPLHNTRRSLRTACVKTDLQKQEDKIFWSLCDKQPVCSEPDLNGLYSFRHNGRAVKLTPCSPAASHRTVAAVVAVAACHLAAAEPVAVASPAVAEVAAVVAAGCTRPAAAAGWDTAVVAAAAAGLAAVAAEGMCLHTGCHTDSLDLQSSQSNIRRDFLFAQNAGKSCLCCSGQYPKQ